jgi:hypothetical protein
MAQILTIPSFQHHSMGHEGQTSLDYDFCESVDLHKPPGCLRIWLKLGGGYCGLEKGQKLRWNIAIATYGGRQEL